jgi:hypothetical protein
MHSILAHAYHLAQHGIAFALKPIWRAPGAAILVALVLRLTRVQPRLAGIVAVLAGWLAVQHPEFSVLPAHPVDRLPGLAVILLAWAWLAPRAGRAALPALAAASSWWIAGAPLSLPGLAMAVVVFPVVWAALALARSFTNRSTGAACIGAAVALAAALYVAGAASHWVYAALVPAYAGLALFGLPEAAAPLALATVLLACQTIQASDRGRFLPVDAAALAPLLALGVFALGRSRQPGGTP